MNRQPTSPDDVQAAVKQHHGLLPFGGRTKSALSTPSNGAVGLDMRGLTGIIDYQPTEYTFTAWAGTPVQAVATELAANGQYLPFDPLWVKQGATLGGTVAANSGGPGRYRYGGVRDFILGLRFVDGTGNLVHGGGKVVKNSAGFDIPKFMVGSLGRFGVFVDLTFKVFPQPRTYATLKASYPTLDGAIQAMYTLSTAPFDMDVLDLEAHDDQFVLLIRLGGLANAMPGRLARLQTFLSNDAPPQSSETVQAEADLALWEQINGLSWLPAGTQLVKLPLTPQRIGLLEGRFTPQARRYSAAGNVAWLAVDDLEALDAVLRDIDLTGLVMVGQSERLYLGERKGLPLAQRVKQALDPHGRFLAV